MNEKTLKLSEVRKNLPTLFEDGTDRVVIVNRGRIHGYLTSARYEDVQELLRRYKRDPEALNAIMRDLTAASAGDETAQDPVK